MADDAIRRALESLEAEIARGRAQHRELATSLAELTRETNTRYERLWREISSELQEGRELLHEMKREVVASTEETRAQTRAIFRMLDRFDANGGEATA